MPLAMPPQKSAVTAQSARDPARFSLHACLALCCLEGFRGMLACLD
jgi:hypothetical protein